MPFDTALTRNIDTMGVPSKKKKLLANTPLKQFLRPIIEEAMIRRMQMMQRVEQPQQRPSPSHLETALGNKEEVL